MIDLSYFQMRASFYPREKKQKVSFKLKELEDIWFCTSKNVKRKLKKYEEKGVLVYTPGKGRGNPSILTFTHFFQKEVEEAINNCIQQEKLEEIVQLIQLPIPRTWFTNSSQEVNNLFGLISSNKSMDVLRSIFTKDIATLDPSNTLVAWEYFLIHQLGDTLVVYDQESDIIKPHIAHHWKIEDDFTKWTFYIRKGIRFHNQQLLTSEDVQYTFERFVINTSPYQWLVDEISSIECVHPYTIRFTLHESNPFFLRYLSFSNLVILPKADCFDENKWIGTGPFRLTSKKNTKIVLEAFEQYFLGRPFLDRVDFYRIDNDGLTTFEINKEKMNEDLVNRKRFEIGFRFLSFNLNKSSIVQNKIFREAMYHIIDVKKMWKDLGRTKLLEASSFFITKSEPQIKNIDRVDHLLKKSRYRVKH
ncbi:ABC transporter substrate-binding protein [Chengkuizengella axinellae]|uniref:ABC transporter substrate-binding protein n=1 Tax=Chengkuizengella axinellae TaxID=3064388 RepID=A0ABT9J4Y5_9BACL|nr:ABC transporter substrate-binding protein [Chengkuizengella sp. 2205SS18-9]MDP5276538.1 ABC transporter substrate-binding protein [Chengkuizengella sp. 2205SS18-9]